MESPRTSSSSSSPASSTSSSSSSIHPASLVDAALHSPHTLRLVNIKISKQLIDYVVDQVIETVDYAMGKSGATSSSRGRTTTTRTPNQIKFTTFASTVLTRAEITTPTLLCTLLYINRARPYLHIALEEWALERVFLGALITASKYLNDSTLKNVHWALCTGVFGKRDVGRIEREFLAVLDWELGVSENELLGLWQSLEWAVELEEREERRVREREARKKALAQAAAKQEREQARQLQLQQQQQSKLFYFSSPSSSNSSGVHSRSSSTDSDLAPPPLPPKSARQRRHAKPMAIDLPQLSQSSSSPASYSSSSSSSSCCSSSSPRTPLTPGDFDLTYPEPEDLERMKMESHPAEDDMRMQVDEDESPATHGVVVVPTIVVEEAAAQSATAKSGCARRSVKRSFGATTMEILKSFPFPGHHHHSHHQQHTTA